jgi:hypothetical protein
MIEKPLDSCARNNIRPILLVVYASHLYLSSPYYGVSLV